MPYLELSFAVIREFPKKYPAATDFAQGLLLFALHEQARGISNVRVARRPPRA